MADDIRRYLSNLESSHEELLIDLLAQATEARMQLRLLRRDLEERCDCRGKAELLDRFREAEQRQQAVVRQIEGDLLLS